MHLPLQEKCCTDGDLAKVSIDIYAILYEYPDWLAIIYHQLYYTYLCKCTRKVSLFLLLVDEIEYCYCTMGLMVARLQREIDLVKNKKQMVCFDIFRRVWVGAIFILG